MTDQPREERPVLPDEWTEFDYSDPDADAVKEEVQRRHKLNKPVDSFVDEERGPIDVIPLSMMLGGKAMPREVLKKPMKHLQLPDQSIPPRGWYKSKIEAGRVRPRPCLLPDAKVNTPWGDKEIQHLQPGDIVLGYNEETGKVAHTYVQGTAKQTKHEYLELELADGRLLRLTPEHLVFTKECGWVEAQTLAEGADIVDMGLRYNSGHMERLCGVYGLLNSFDGKLYIGSAVNMVDRMNRHMRELAANKHSNMHLQAAYNRGDKFELVILEECDKSALTVREQYHMDLHGSLHNSKGYNMTIAGRTAPSEDGIRRIKEARTGRTWEEIFGPEKAARMKADLRKQTGKNNPNYGNKGELNPRTGKSNLELFGPEEAERLRLISVKNGKLPMSGDAKKKLSDLRKGKSLSDGHKQAIADGLKRVNFSPPPMTDAQRAKISATLKRRYASGELEHVREAVGRAHRKEVVEVEQ